MNPTVLKITVLLYPLGAGAMAINVFFLSLLGSWLGLAVLSTTAAIIIGSAIAVPLTWLFARHIKSLMDEADEAAPD